MSILEKNTSLLKRKASELGFNHCGIAKAEYLEEEADGLEKWLNQRMHAGMSYMENYFDKRLDPTKLVPGAKSVVSLMLNYYPEKNLAKQKDNYKIAKYAYGKDYHFVIKDKLKTLLNSICQKIGEIHGRVFVDSAPVMERAWAKKSGLGWIGKNSLLLNREYGSFVLLAELILDLELIPDVPMKDYCGSCTRCIDACPTDAIVAPQVVDSGKCISYFTIECQESIPQTVQGKFENWIFGCDICQDVCPWNKFSRPHQTPEFNAHPDLARMERLEWEDITEEVFQKLFKKSAVKRAKFEGLVRNIQFVSQNTDQTERE